MGNHGLLPISVSVVVYYYTILVCQLKMYSL